MRSTRLAAVGLFCCLSLQISACTTEEPLHPVSQPSSRPAEPPSSKSATPNAVPDVVGMRLADAREQLSTQGYTTIEEVDTTGAGRPVVDPVNWVVASQSPAAGTSADPTAPITLDVRKPSDSEETSVPEAGAVPDVVCLDLQAAQDAMQAAGFYNLGSEDATGQGRQQLVDRNWVVVDQSPVGGARPEPLAPITLSAVKFGEPTGSSNCDS